MVVIQYNFCFRNDLKIFLSIKRIDFDVIQNRTNDGGIYDADPTDDSLLSWQQAIRTRNVDFLRDNPLAKLYVKVESAATTAAETAGAVAGGANDPLKGVAALLKWAPYALAGVGMVGLTALVLAASGLTTIRTV